LCLECEAGEDVSEAEVVEVTEVDLEAKEELLVGGVARWPPPEDLLPGAAAMLTCNTSTLKGLLWRYM